MTSERDGEEVCVFVTAHLLSPVATWSTATKDTKTPNKNFHLRPETSFITIISVVDYLGLDF